MELLSLPEPAASVWKRAGRALQKALKQTGNPPSRWSIGVMDGHQVNVKSTTQIPPTLPSRPAKERSRLRTPAAPELAKCRDAP